MTITKEQLIAYLDRRCKDCERDLRDLYSRVDDPFDNFSDHVFLAVTFMCDQRELIKALLEDGDIPAEITRDRGLGGIFDNLSDDLSDKQVEATDS